MIKLSINQLDSDYKKPFEMLNKVLFQNDQFKKFQGEIFVCGGWVRDALRGDHFEPNDLDIFCTSQQTMKEVTKVIREFLRRGSSYVSEVVSLTPTPQEFISFFGTSVQVIHFPAHASIGNILEDFDFSFCQFGFDGDYLYFPVQAWIDLSLRRINFVGTKAKGKLIPRLINFQNREWTNDQLERNTLKKVMKAISKLTQKDIDNDYYLNFYMEDEQGKKRKRNLVVEELNF